MKFSDLIQSKDGSLSLTKLAASTFHLSLAGWVSWSTYAKGFDVAIWTLYATFAVGHAAYDKTAAMVSNFKTKQAEGQGNATTS
jgi:hypothetical protein